MKKLMLLFIGFFVTSTAQATLVFSDVTYTSDTVSFRTTGDLSGYSLPSRPQYFGISFRGDLFSTGINPNISWSNSIFNGASIQNTGYSGDWSSWNNPGAWLQFSSPLTSADVALGSITTLTLGANVLNTASLTGEIVFTWDVDSSFTNFVELGSVTVGSSAVPVPATIVLLGIGLLGFAAARNRQAA